MDETRIGFDPINKDVKVRLVPSPVGEVQLDVSSDVQAPMIMRFVESGLNLRPPFRYLDMGHGKGTTVRTLREQYGVEAYGVDKDPNELVLNDGEIFFNEDLRGGTHFPDSFFDVVAEQLMFDQIRYIERRPEDVAPIIGEMKRLLRPGGFYFSVTGGIPPTELLEQAGFALYKPTVESTRVAYQLQK